MSKDLRLGDEVRALVLALAPADVTLAHLADEAVLSEDGVGLDSIALVDLLCACEDRFGAELPAEVLLEHEGGLTVAQLVRLVEAVATADP